MEENNEALNQEAGVDRRSTEGFLGTDVDDDRDGGNSAKIDKFYTSIVRMERVPAAS